MRRFTAIVLCAGLLLGASHAAAGEKSEKIRQLIAMDGAATVADQVIAQQTPAIRQAFRQHYPNADKGAEAAYVAAFAAALRDRRDQIIARIEAVYDRTFSEAEIDAILAFFTSPAGRKYQSSGPSLLSEARKEGRDWGAENAPALAKLARDAVAAEGLKLK